MTPHDIDSTGERVPSDTADRREILRRALIDLRAANATARKERNRRTEPIAVVGAGCHLPGDINDVEEFWRLLLEKESAIREVPSERWDAARYYANDPDAPGRMYSKRAGMLGDVKGFDADFFGIPPREARNVDPQQRLVLEVAWEALEHAGIAPDSLKGSKAGVFIGAGRGDYERLIVSADNASSIDGYVATGHSTSFVANRLSYVLGLEGPSMVVDTACSSSLVALHLAIQSLRARECDLALVGGVNVLLSPLVSVALSKSRMLSPEGRCKTFDASADGYVRAEGCGIVVLRRLSSAIEAGDDIMAVVRGSAVNQDGRSSGITVPNPGAQERLIQSALRAAQVAPAEMGYVETHGTGTALGDPIEVRALARALGRDRPSGQPVALGAVKANIGHLEAGAGIVGFIKAVLVVQRGVIPATPGLTVPNPHVAWDELPVSVPVEATDWDAERRVAGVSAFGFGGTNAHAILESPSVKTQRLDQSPPTATATAVKVSAAGPAALRAGAARAAAFLGKHADLSVNEVAWTANVGRADLSQRVVVIARDVRELRQGLHAVAVDGHDTNVIRGGSAARVPHLAFIVPAAGPWLAGAMYDLYRESPAVTETLDSLAATLGSLSQPPLSALLKPGADAVAMLRDRHTSRQALYAAAIALNSWWRSVGVVPDAVFAAEPDGVWAAGALAGAFTVEDGARFVADRAVLSGVAPPDAAALGSPSVDLVLPGSPSVADASTAAPKFWQQQAGQTAFKPGRTVYTSHAGHVGVCLGPIETDGRQALPAQDSPLTRLASVGRGESSEQLLRSLAELWVRGVPIRWNQVQRRPRRAVKLPTYPFQRKTHWAVNEVKPSAPSTSTSGLSPRFTHAATGELIGEVELSLTGVPFLDEHRAYGHVVVPGVVFLEMVLRTLERATTPAPSLTRLSLSRPLVLTEEEARTVQIIADPIVAGRTRVRVFSQDSTQVWHEHLEAIAGPTQPEPPPTVPSGDITATLAECPDHMDHARFYRHVSHRDFTLGPSFRLVRDAWRGHRHTVARIGHSTADAPATVAGVRTELMVWDACAQLIVVAAQHGVENRDQPVYLGTGFERLIRHRPLTSSPLWCAASAQLRVDGSAVGDLCILDAEGPVLQLLGVAFQPVAPATLERIRTKSEPDGGVGYPALDLVELRSLSREDRRKLVLEQLVQLTASVLGSTADGVSSEIPLNMTLDSLMVAELRNAVKQQTGIAVPLSMFFDDRGLIGIAAAIEEALSDVASTPDI